MRHSILNLLTKCSALLSISTSLSNANFSVPILTLYKLKSRHQTQLTQHHSLSKHSISRLDYSENQDVAKANLRITQLCREGQISDARELFDEMLDPDVISWTALISGYLRCGKIEEARELFDRVDAKKNVVTWTSMISGYMKMRRVSEAERMFYEMTDKNVVSWNTMIHGYVQCGRVDKALELFERMGERNVVSWNSMITGLVNCGRVEEARTLFDQMPERNVISWTIMVSGLSKNEMVDEARAVFDGMPVRNVVSWNAMITGYAQNSRLGEAFDLFERMPERDMQSWNTIIAGFVQNGELHRAKMLFKEMPKKNAVSWTVMINGYVKDGKSEEALKLFVSMTRECNVKPIEGTFVSVLGACSNLAGLGEGLQIHQVISKSVCQESELVRSAVINMYSKCGELAVARKMFDDGLRGQKDLVSWNTIIAAYGHHGCGREAIKLFEEMQNQGFEPNDVTFMGLLSACSHAGLVDEGLKYFELLLRNESIQVKQGHHTCLIDLCGRAGRLKEAFQLIKQLPSEASPHVRDAVLSACIVHGDADIRELAENKLLNLEPEKAVTYMLLYNLYASSGKWKEAAILRLKMKNKGIKKQPGCSWIDVGNRFHVFVVGDRSHRESDIIYTSLFNLHKKMKRIGSTLLYDLMMEEDFSLI